MLERKLNIFQLIFIDGISLVLLICALIVNQIKFFSDFFPSCYLMIFYINSAFLPIRTMIMNLFVLGIIEDAVFDYPLGMSALVYLVFAYPVYKIGIFNMHNIKLKGLLIMLVIVLMALMKSILVAIIMKNIFKLEFAWISTIFTVVIIATINYYTYKVH